MYCGAKIINDSALVGKITVDHSQEFENKLKLAKASLEIQNWADAKILVNDALAINLDCPDAWYMNALLSKVDNNIPQCNSCIQKAKAVSDKSLNIFNEEDINRCYGCKVTFRLSSRLNADVVLTVDGKLFEFPREVTMGLSKGEHNVTCKVKSHGTWQSPDKSFNLSIEGDGVWEINWTPSVFWGKNPPATLTLLQ